MVPNLAAALRLMLVTDDALVHGRNLVAICRAAVRGGVTAVELRLKRATPRELVAQARSLIAALDVPILINDRLDVALAAGAAGVHLGPDDLPVAWARRAAPGGFLIGASVGTAAEVENGQDADYWGVGPWRVSGTKADAGPALGPDGFSALIRRAGNRPCVAIGGVIPEDVTPVRKAGGVGVAVVSGILAAGDVAAAARRYVERGIAG